jgi:plastocyanin domain-containing protein
MTPDKFLVTLLGFAAIAFIVWFFWLVKRPGVKADVNSAGFQEAMVLVKGGYTPDVIVVERGRPVRLNFVRAESASCSGTVVFPEFNKSAYLPEGETVPVEVMPGTAG